MNAGRERLDPLEDVGAHAAHGVAGHQRHLVDPHRALSREQDREAGERVARVRPQRERVLLPVAGDVRDPRLA